ncbi:hypothetical protein ACFWII_00255 [Streptomyces sp. NPDC127063]|uniref:hypothetical protein n=1 Tax=Streptomyces sp. NPDC127063 TaxID=3347123 RepID=UPI0036567F47
MIRIVTAGRVRRLEQDAEQARTRAREIQGQADAAWRRHVREVWELTARAESAESDAGILRKQTYRLEAASERVRLLEGELEAAKRSGRSLVLLLHWGEPHSIHRSREDAFAYAATQGAPVHGWTPSDERVHAEATWQTIAFTADETVMGFRPALASGPEPMGGAA